MQRTPYISYELTNSCFFRDMHSTITKYPSIYCITAVSPAPSSRTNSTASRKVTDSSFHSDRSGAQPDLHVTSCRLWPPSPATASRPGLHLPLTCPPCGRSSRKRRRRCRPSPRGRRPGQDLEPQRLLWVKACSAGIEGMGSIPVGD